MDDVDFKQARILVVEDDFVNYTLLSEILYKHKLDVVRAINAEQAIEMIKSDNTIKLVLMDIRLPGMDGNYATREIKQIRPELPVVAQSAYALNDEIDTSLEAGCDAYITKPIDFKDLKKILVKFINK
ncbi:MAG: hypothetical protein B6I20_07690 [Bacteroidetes bacterium 4572_117]|nr:MAG: hypothetical protein B6I20_07690 [Bacteroidetes bacterium 4572_117]